MSGWCQELSLKSLGMSHVLRCTRSSADRSHHTTSSQFHRAGLLRRSSWPSAAASGRPSSSMWSAQTASSQNSGAPATRPAALCQAAPMQHQGPQPQLQPCRACLPPSLIMSCSLITRRAAAMQLAACKIASAEGRRSMPLQSCLPPCSARKASQRLGGGQYTQRGLKTWLRARRALSRVAKPRLKAAAAAGIGRRIPSSRCLGLWALCAGAKPIRHRAWAQQRSARQPCSSWTPCTVSRAPHASQLAQCQE